MGKVWIENLAAEIKSKSCEAAELYGRNQHRAGIVTEEGKVFFTALVSILEQDMSEIRSQLQGSIVSCETSVTKDGPTQVRLNRSRFPWFDANLKHDDADIALDYVQGRGAAGNLSLISTDDRKSARFLFKVDSQDKLSVVESFGDHPHQFNQPDELAKHILELLFKI